MEAKDLRFVQEHMKELLVVSHVPGPLEVSIPNIVATCPEEAQYSLFFSPLTQQWFPLPSKTPQIPSNDTPVFSAISSNWATLASSSANLASSSSDASAKINDNNL